MPALFEDSCSVFGSELPGAGSTSHLHLIRELAPASLGPQTVAVLFACWKIFEARSWISSWYKPEADLVPFFSGKSQAKFTAVNLLASLGLMAKLEKAIARHLLTGKAASNGHRLGAIATTTARSVRKCVVEMRPFLSKYGQKLGLAVA
jgi:hypothetical protein